MFKYQILDNVLKESECQKIIQTYQPLLDLNNPSKFSEFSDYQHSRYDFKNIKLSEILYERIKDLLPPQIKEISHRWYMSHYLPNKGHISEHFDGNIIYGDKISQYTFLIYLNDDFEDGETVISDPYFKEKIKIKPKIGRILLLDQDILHYAEKPQKKSKYILRSDLMIQTS